MASLRISFLLLLVVAMSVGGSCHRGGGGAGGGKRRHDYADALTMSLIFFEGQRSGKLPATQRATWRKDSALSDGHDVVVDLVGGYYDGGDNVKFGFPVAFTTTVLAWCVIEFRDQMGREEASHAEEAVRWETDYLLKATAEPNKVYVQVGEPHVDHRCWERPEDMDTPRTVYSIDAERPGSEISAEIAAALAAASIVFRDSDPSYAAKLLERAIQVFDFADKYRGSYNDSVGSAVCPYYCDYNGYEDELFWGAAWIHKASNSSRHWDYVTNNMNKFEHSGSSFGWDGKVGGAFVLLYQDYITKTGSPSDYIYKKAEEVVCRVLPESPTRSVNYTPGGLLFKPGGSNMQNPTSASFLLVVLARYLANANQTVQCGNNVVAPPSRLIEVAKGQVDYILGDNPLNMSFMVGYGDKFPLRIQHRAASLPSIDRHPEKITCEGGKTYFKSEAPNPNLHIGAVVGGPEVSDDYIDNRESAVQAEPTVYYSGPLVGLLAYFKDPNPMHFN